MKHPFTNDLHAIAYQAFRNLYPNKHLDLVQWCNQIEGGFDGEVQILEGGFTIINISPDITMSDSLNVFLGQLTTVAAGTDDQTTEVWHKTAQTIADEFDRIFQENFGLPFVYEIKGAEDGEEAKA